MAGSIVWRRYVDDGGTNYAIRCDESNYELVNGADSGLLSAPLPPALPKGVKPRQVVLESNDGTIQRTCYVETLADYAAIAEGDTFTVEPGGNFGVSVTTVLTVILKTGEIRRRQPRVTDTGLDDGDQT